MPLVHAAPAAADLAKSSATSACSASRLDGLRARAALAGAAGRRPADADRRRPTSARRRSAGAASAGRWASAASAEISASRPRSTASQLPNGDPACRRAPTASALHLLARARAAWRAPGLVADAAAVAQRRALPHRPADERRPHAARSRVDSRPFSLDSGLRVRARRALVRRAAAPDAGAAPALRQHAVSRPGARCRNFDSARQGLQLRSRSSARTRSPASTASPTPTSSPPA